MEIGVRYAGAVLYIVYVLHHVCTYGRIPPALFRRVSFLPLLLNGVAGGVARPTTYLLLALSLWPYISNPRKKTIKEK